MINSILGLVYFIVALGIIVLVHELGHLVVAKRNGIHCYEFSIGMGPRIVKLHTDAKGTEYSIRAIPLGGYVQMAGESTNDESNDYKKVSKEEFLSSKSPFVKFKVLVAGSTMNVILAFLIFFVIAFLNGVPSNSNVAMTLEPEIIGTETSAQRITIDSINNNEITTFSQIEDSLDENQLEIIYMTDDGVKKETVISKDASESYSFGKAHEKANVFSAISYSIVMPFKIIALSIISLFMLFKGTASVSDLTGPVGIYTMSSQISTLGFSAMLSWIAFLSVSIGFTNLLPIPGLDGGHIIFALYEGISGKKASQKIQERALNVGMIILLCIFGLTLVNDISRLF